MGAQKGCRTCSWWRRAWSTAAATLLRRGSTWRTTPSDRNSTAARACRALNAAQTSGSKLLNMMRRRDDACTRHGGTVAGLSSTPYTIRLDSRDVGSSHVKEHKTACSAAWCIKFRHYNGLSMMTCDKGESWQVNN